MEKRQKKISKCRRKCGRDEAFILMRIPRSLRFRNEKIHVHGLRINDVKLRTEV